MKKILMLAALALPAFAQTFDFSTLDKLGANARNSSTIDLDANMIRMAASGFLNSDANAASVKNLVAGLTGITVRSYEFDQPGKYSESDLDPLRAFLKQQKWNRIIESKEGKEHAEIFVLPQPDNRIGGLAIISAEAKEVAVVLLSGSINMEDLGKLGGTMGLPKLDQLGEALGQGKAKPKPKE